MDRSGPEYEAWTAWRAQGITATDVARSFTGKYGGMYAVIAEKRGITPDFDYDTLDRMQRGHDLEPVIAQMVELCTGMHVIGRQVRCEHPDRPEWRCTPDGFLAPELDTPLDQCDTGCEIKTYDTSIGAAWGYFEVQCQWQMHVTGWTRNMLAVSAYDPSIDLVHGPQLRVLDADPLLQAQLVDVADTIARHLANDTWPEPDGSEQAGEILAVRHNSPGHDVDVVDLSDLEADCARLIELNDATRKGGEVDTIKNRIRARIGDHVHGRTHTADVTWSMPRRQLDETRFLADHPQFAKTTVDTKAAEAALGKPALDAYRLPTGSRSLTVRPIKENR